MSKMRLCVNPFQDGTGMYLKLISNKCLI
ncbi:hypothetical protein F383_26218 [Gossypium arboreum]|uniref:Uncharacterized protein n=1 Tax=Gossypium arboreum TaxID=29729 RepID=A0A0B0P2T0_GOSAR|nr:hypothetical protein F383_23716 [Gossypium arboreum]KHG19320.1 hypothetical protein F383_26218 [Gossypium arboreum]